MISMSNEGRLLEGRVIDEPDCPYALIERGLDHPRLAGTGASAQSDHDASGRREPSPYASLNLGDHVGDDPLAVAAIDGGLNESLPAAPCWLQQVHGTRS
jgi:hypothetical protein